MLIGILIFSVPSKRGIGEDVVTSPVTFMARAKRKRSATADPKRVLSRIILRVELVGSVNFNLLMSKNSPCRSDADPRSKLSRICPFSTSVGAFSKYGPKLIGVDI